MQRMGLSRAELRAFHARLCATHTIQVKVGVLNLAGHQITSITPVVLSGQVIVDMDSEVTRSLQLELLDPLHALNFDSTSPSDGALFSDRMIRVYYSVRVPDLDRIVTAIPFTGPITRFERTGDVVTLEAQGKEAFARRPAWVPRTIKKGTPKVEAIRTLMEDATGENKFAFPELTTRLPKPVSLSRTGIPWRRCRAIANSMNRQLFYPGTGRCTLRRWPSQPVITFARGDGGALLSDLSVSYELRRDFANVIVVVGGKPKGARKRVRYAAMAEEKHPLSPQNLGRNGVPGYVVERIQNDDLRSRAECRRVAERMLARRMRETVEVAADVLPFPHLDEGDLVAYETDDGVLVAPLRRWVLPLHTEGAPVMSTGYHRDTLIRRRRIRRP